jgi:hypothetical protein
MINIPINITDIDFISTHPFVIISMSIIHKSQQVGKVFLNDFRLKYCILKEDTKNNISGSNMHKFVLRRLGFRTNCYPTDQR